MPVELYGATLPAITEDAIGLQVGAIDNAFAPPVHVDHPHYFQGSTKKLISKHGLFAEKDSELILRIGYAAPRNVGFGVTVKTDWATFVDQLYFPARETNGWTYGVIDRDTLGRRLQVKSGKTIEKEKGVGMGRVHWVLKLEVWPILQWESSEFGVVPSKPLNAMHRSAVAGGIVQSYTMVKPFKNPRYTRIFDVSTQDKQTLDVYVMTGDHQDVKAGVSPAPA